MVRVPLPQQPTRAAPQGGFSAPRTAVPVGPAGQQLEEVGQATERAGLGVARQATLLDQQLQDQRDVAAAKEAQALAEEFIGEFDRDFMSRAGKAATGKALEETFQGLQEKVQRIRDALDQGPREPYQDVMRRRMAIVYDRWRAHEIAQTRIYEDAASQAMIEAKEKTARDEGPTGEDGLGAPTMLEPLKVEIRAWADTRGYGPEQTAHEVLRRTTRVHSSIIGDMLRNGHSTQARAYFDRHRAEITADEVDALKNDLQHATVKEVAAQVAIHLRDSLGGGQWDALTKAVGRGLSSSSDLPLQPSLSSDELVAGALPRIQGMFEAGEITLEVAEATRAEILRMAGDFKAVQLATDKVILNESMEWMIDNPYASVEQLPSDLYRRVRERGLREDLNEFSGSKGRFSTDQEFFSRLYLPGGDGLFSMEKDEFDFLAVRKLSPQHLRTARSLWADANKVQDPTLTKGKSFSTQFRDALRLSGITDEQDIQSLHDDALERVHQFEEIAGKTASGKERRALIDEAFRDLVLLDRGDRLPWPMTGVRVVERNVIAGTLTIDESTGMTEERRIEYQRTRRPPARRKGAFVDQEMILTAWQRNYPKLPIPAALLDTTRIYSSEIPKEDRDRIIEELVRQDRPVSEALIAAQWLAPGDEEQEER